MKPSGVLARLKRTEEHLKSFIAMIEADRKCLDMAKQLFVIEKALVKAKRELIRDHMEPCLDDGIAGHKGL